jgi:hypothetical protein
VVPPCGSLWDVRRTRRDEPRKQPVVARRRGEGVAALPVGGKRHAADKDSLKYGASLRRAAVVVRSVGAEDVEAALLALRSAER